MDLLSDLILFSALQGFFLSIMLLVLGVRNKLHSNYWFALILLSISVYLVEWYALMTGWIANNPQFMLSTYPALFFIGPLVYIHFRSSRGLKISRKHHLLFLLPVTIYFLFIPFYVANTSVPPDQCRSNIMASFNQVSLITKPWFFPLYTVLFIGLALHNGRSTMRTNNTKGIGNVLNSREKWQMTLNYLLLFYFLISLSYGIVSTFKPQFIGAFFSMYLFLLLCLIVHVVAAKIIISPSLFSNVKPFKTSRKYERSSLDGKMSQAVLPKIRHFIEGERAFLQSDLTIHEVSEVLGISRNKVSQVINEQIGLSFQDYINSQRIEEAKRILKNGDVQVTHLALDVGFNNKVSFYRSFKKFTGKSPTEFTRQL